MSRNKILNFKNPKIMNKLQNLLLWVMLFLGLSTQTQAQCTVNALIFPDTSTCPVMTLYSTAFGGTMPYSYQWSNGATTAQINGLTSGTYYLTVTDAQACTAVDSFTIFVSSPIQIGTNITPENCGQANGAIDMTVFGGSGAFQIDWYTNNFNYVGSTEDIDSLQAGSYIVYIYDLIQGCYYQQGNIVVGSTGGTVSINVMPADCNQQNGAAFAVINGFSNPTFLWSNGATTPAISPLASGVYSLTVSDGACTATATAVVQGGFPFMLYLWGNGCPADSLQAYVSGGVAPYTFIWSTGSTATLTQSIDFEGTSGPGLYSVTVTDASGCSASETVNVSTAMTASYTVQNASCAGNDGAINLSVSGGDGNYFYIWSNGQFTQDLSGLTPGIYSVDVYDSTQCWVTVDSIVVGGGGNAFVNAYTVPANCADSLGEVVQVVTGLNNPNFIWSNGATTSSINNLASGWYGVTISDNSGCTLIRNYYVPYDSSCYIHINGYVYNVSFSNTCTPSGAAPVAYVMVRLQPSGAVTFTNANGYYDFGFTVPGNYTVEFVNNSGNYTVLCPSVNSIPVNNTVLGGNYSGNNFYIVSPNAQDLSINLTHYSTVTPGFGYWTRATYCNIGQLPMSGTVEFTYDANLVFDVIWAMNGSGNPQFTGHNAAAQLLTFSFSNLQPGHCGSLYVDFNTPTTLPLGTVVVNTATVFPINNDATPANNTSVDSTTCVGSWDPNEKLAKPVRSGTEREGGDIYMNDEEIQYTIHFQNLGTAPAYRVVIRDELEANLLIESIRNVEMSHNGQLSIENGNELVFTFDNIILPAADFDFHGSNGYVKFTINRVSGLPLGTEINNDAAIYFDFNAPIITNTNTLTIAEPTAVTKFENILMNSNVFPNPFFDQFTLNYELTKESDVSIEIFDALGARIRSLKESVSEMPGQQIQQFSVSDLSPGVYFLSVSTAEGRVMHKIIKR
jgi:uncharacterized repeat protein (TIGR01451 family)